MPKIEVGEPTSVINIHTRVAFKKPCGHGAVGRVIGIKNDELAVEIDRGLAAQIMSDPECCIIKRADAFVCPEGDLEDEETEDEKDD